MSNELQDIRAAIGTTTLDSTLAALRRVAAAQYNTQEQQELDSLATSYRYMKQYLLTGYNDAKRAPLYQSLQRKAYDVAARLMAQALRDSNRSYAQAYDEAQKSNIAINDIGHTLRLLTGELAGMDDSSNPQRRAVVRDRLFTYRKAIFNTLYTTPVLDDSSAQTLTSALLSSDITLTDARLLLSALLLAQQECFDIRRFALFVDIYCQHSDDDVRQYALVALVLALPPTPETFFFADEIEEGCTRLAACPTLVHDLVETQLQVLLCADTKEMKTTVENEIMPILRKSATQINRFWDESEIQLLDELLRPDKEEQTMEELERGIDRIRELHNSGADIYFAGFAQSKHFAFFYTLINWFIPFSFDHPQVAAHHITRISPAAVMRLMQQQHFCEGDKYSFFLVFEKIADQLPQAVVEALCRGEVQSGLGDDIPIDVAYRRRLFLQDLYRFYTLYPSKGDFHNPFASERSVVFAIWEPIKRLLDDTTLLHIARQLLPRGYTQSLDRLLSGSFDELNISYLKLQALRCCRQKNYAAAVGWFTKALSFEPDNGLLLRKTAETAMQIPDYALAKRLYATYLALPATTAPAADDEYGYALCCLYTHDTKKATDTLYKLYYLHDDNVAYREALAWALLQGSKYDDARQLYVSLDSAILNQQGSIRRALTLWLTHDRGEAVASLHRLAQQEGLSPQALRHALAAQNDNCCLALSAVDLSIITDLTFDNLV